jgi:hypothetical protein
VQAAPDIAGRMTVLWIGGSLVEGRSEYNRDTDPAAADLGLGHPDLAV